MTAFEDIRTRLWDETGKDWALELHWCLTEPVCPIFSVVSEDDDEILVKERFVDGSFKSIEEEIVKSCSDALAARSHKGEK